MKEIRGNVIVGQSGGPAAVINSSLAGVYKTARDTIKKLSDYSILNGSKIRFMGVPKTIDNDLAATDHTPGYGSAAKYIGSITKEVIRDGLVYDQQNVTLLEIMGRNAGWLTGAAALAKCEDCEGPDMIFLPEIDFDVQEFMKKVADLHKKKKSVVVAISEGVKVADGRYVCELTDNIDYVDAFGHKQLTGTARYLAEKISREVGCKTRAIEFNSLQRCASHMVSRVDITQAFQVGGADTYYGGWTAEASVLYGCRKGLKL